MFENFMPGQDYNTEYFQVINKYYLAKITN